MSGIDTTKSHSVSDSAIRTGASGTVAAATGVGVAYGAVKLVAKGLESVPPTAPYGVGIAAKVVGYGMDAFAVSVLAPAIGTAAGAITDAATGGQHTEQHIDTYEKAASIGAMAGGAGALIGKQLYSLAKVSAASLRSLREQSDAMIAAAIRNIGR